MAREIIYLEATTAEVYRQILIKRYCLDASGNACHHSHFAIAAPLLTQRAGIYPESIYVKETKNQRAC